MNTNSNPNNSVEASTSTQTTTANSFHPLTISTDEIRSSTDNNNNNNNDYNNNQAKIKSIRHFSCAVCNIDLTNQKHFNSHLNSRQHQQTQSIHDVLQSVAPEYRSAYKAMFSSEMLNKKVFDRELCCKEQIKQTKEPLLGLNYIIEFQFEDLNDPAQYVCELCHCKCSTQSILSHILNIQHQRKFLKIHHPDMYERVLTASNIRSEQQRLIENYAKQIQSRHGGPGNIQLHIQFNSFIGQKSIVFAVTFNSQTEQKKISIQLTSKTFQDYDYSYEDEPNKGNEEFTSEPIVNHYEDSIQRGLSAEDLLYPFERQFWYQNYKDLLESRPIDPHSVTYQEPITESNKFQPFQNTSENDQLLFSSNNRNENHLTLENDQTIRRNTSQPSNRRVILDTNRSPTLNNNEILRISSTKKKNNFDGYTLLNEQQKKTNCTNAVLDEQSARAILAASGLLQSDEEDEQHFNVSNKSSRQTNENLKKKSDQTVSPLIAKRMLDAVLNGDLDVVHIQPYFSTFVNLIQSGQIELERHQAEKLLQKVLVTPSKNEIETNSRKRIRSNSHSKERHSPTSNQNEDHRSSTESNSHRYSTSSSTRRVHLINENKTSNGKRSVR